MQSLVGKRVAITGGTAGLGLALVRELTERGADVACIARRAALTSWLVAGIGRSIRL